MPLLDCIQAVRVYDLLNHYTQGEGICTQHIGALHCGIWQDENDGQ